jgi:homoserine dehydrogenase
MGAEARVIRIGMLGCGTVGRGVLELLARRGDAIAARLGARLEVTRVFVRSPDKVRGVVEGALVTSSAEAVLDDPAIDVVVEVAGGLEPAGTWVRRAIAAGKAVVTANKALIAAQGAALLAEAEERGTDLYFEGSVAGGIPILRTLREALASDRVLSLVGIVNGTSNYILSRMSDEGMDFAAALAEAQRQGYAEADPTLDVGGGDAAHKLTILATLAFGARIDARTIHTEGITAIGPLDVAFARRFGFVVKSLAIAKDLGHALDLRVHPALVPARHVLASVSGALNAVWIEGEALGPCLLSGKGAGGLPTAVSVVSDVIDVARNLQARASGRVPQFSTRGKDLASRPVLAAGEVVCRYFLRMTVQDRPGVLARIAGALGAHDVSIEQMVQEGRGDVERPVQLVILTHAARERDVGNALREIDALTVVAAPTGLIRIEAL